MSQIKAKYERIKEKLKKHDVKRKIMEAELLALQHVCPHEDVREWNDGGGYKPDWITHYWQCNNCGLSKTS